MSRSLYFVKTQPKIGPVFISHYARGTKSAYVIPVYPQLPPEEIACRKMGVTNKIIHPLVKRTSMVKIDPAETTPKLLKDWQKQIDETNRFPGYLSRDKMSMSKIYKKK